MKRIVKHLRIYVFRGLFAMIPIFLSILAVRLLYTLIDKRVIAFLDRFVEVRHFPGLGILLVLVCLYLIGLIISNVIGRQLFHLIDRIGRRIPFIKSVYTVGKQLAEGLSGMEGEQSFKKVVLVDLNNNKMWFIGFVAGQIFDQRTGESLLRIFMPNVPTPTSGFIMIVKESQTIDPGWTVEEAIKMFVSGAIISPKEIKKSA